MDSPGEGGGKELGRAGEAGPDMWCGAPVGRGPVSRRPQGVLPGSSPEPFDVSPHPLLGRTEHWSPGQGVARPQWSRQRLSHPSDLPLQTGD